MTEIVITNAAISRNSFIGRPTIYSEFPRSGGSEGLSPLAPASGLAIASGRLNPPTRGGA